MRSTVTHYKINLAVVLAVTVMSIGFSAHSMTTEINQHCASKNTLNLCIGFGSSNGTPYRCAWVGSECKAIAL